MAVKAQPIRYSRRQLIMLGVAFVALVAVFVYTQRPAAPPPGYVSRAILGDDWPLTVDEGVLTCTGSGGLGAVTFTTGSTAYAVNGVAVQRGAGIDIAPILVAGKDISPVLERGLALCT